MSCLSDLLISAKAAGMLTSSNPIPMTLIMYSSQPGSGTLLLYWLVMLILKQGSSLSDIGAPAEAEDSSGQKKTKCRQMDRKRTYLRLSVILSGCSVIRCDPTHGIRDS